MTVVGSAEITITPQLTGFEAQLRSQLQPILQRVESQITPLFARAGSQAAASFSKDFSSALQSQIGTAARSIASSKTLTDAGATAGQRFGRSVAVESGNEITRGLSAGIDKATSGVSNQVQKAGVTSGRAFGSGFGEGFAALAAFAIASRIKGFFEETAQAAIRFETAFAGVRRVVEDTPQGFNQLRDSILSMSERLPFAAEAIAKTAAEAGRLGVQRANIESFTETILKFATITGQAPETAATAFAKFATVTQTSLAQSEHLADVVLKLGTAFAANETEVLEFTRRLTPLSKTFKISADDILAFSTGIVQAGGRAEAGSTAITQAFTKMSAAARSGGVEALNFAKVIGVNTVDAFQQLLTNDPTEAFTRLLEGIQRAGSNATGILDELGLGSQRVGVQLLGLAQASDAVRSALDKSKDSAGELKRQFEIFAQTPAARLETLHNQIERTRIELGSKLAPALTLLLKPIAALDSATVGLAATFAGLAALAFGFVRFSNIIREFSKTLGQGALTAEEFATAMKISAQTGASFAKVMQVVQAEKKSLVAVQEELTAGNERLAASFRTTQAGTIGFVEAFKAARASQTSFAAEQAKAVIASANQARVNASARIVAASMGPAFNTATDAVILNTRALLEQAEASNIASTAADRVKISNLEAARTAFTAAGGFGALVSAVGKLSIFALIADFATQALEGVRNFFDEVARGEADVDLVTAKLGQLAVGATDMQEVFKAARIDVSALGQALIDLGDDIGNSLVGPLGIIDHFITDRLAGSGIPVVSQLAGAFGKVQDVVEGLANRIPLLGRAITTDTEAIQKRFADLNEGLSNILSQQGPAVAGGVLKLLEERLTDLGHTAKEQGIGFEDFKKKLNAANEAQKILGTDADTARQTLLGLGLSADQASAAMTAFGFSADAAAGNLNAIIGSGEAAKAVLDRISQASQQFDNRVRELSNPIQGIISDQQKLAKSGRTAARDTVSSARAIADAERALAEAREDSARRIADAERAVASAQEDAARRIADARRKLDESRIDSARRLRDAQEELQDFEAALARVGGARTAEDEIRLRELREAVSDTAQDAVRTEAENRRAVVEAQEEGSERIAEARRKLAQTEEDAAKKIEEALLRLARAHEDAARRSQKAAADTASAVKATTATITSGFAKQARELNQFSDLLTALVPRITAAFGGDLDISEAFLSQLTDMGVDAVPLLKSLVGSSDKELKNLAKAFGNQIKAAKRAADFQFDKFPDNFKEKTGAAVNSLIDELDRGVDAFDALPDKSGEVANLMATDLGNMARQLQVFADQTGVQLSTAARHFLDLALSTNDPITRVNALKNVIAEIRSKAVTISATVKLSGQVKELNDLLDGITNPQLRKEIIAQQRNTFFVAFPEAADGTKDHPFHVIVEPHGASGKTVVGPLAQVPKAQFGSTMAAGMPILVGKHTAEELFVPSSAGAIFKHSDTSRILAALKVARTGAVVQNINVSEVAEDPLATARAVSFAIGSGGAVR